jgi:primosomal replication protein N
MNLLGDNFVKLQGKITKKKVTTYPNGSTLFKCSLAISAPPSYDKYQYVGVSTWGTLAEQLTSVKEGSWMRVHGHLEKHSFKSKCNFCNGPTTIYWTDVVIDNYVIIGEMDD